MDIRTIKFTLILLAAMFFLSCQEDFNTPGKDTDEKTVVISFELDQILTQTDSKGEVKTRSLRSTDEDLTNLNLKFYLFKKDNGTSSFLFNPDPLKVTVNKVKDNEYTAAFKMPDENYGTIEMLVLAHYNGNAPTNGMSVESFSTTSLVKELKGAYDYTKPITLWGKCSFDSSPKQINTSVILIRNMARIGLFIENKVDATYKMKSIQSVRVYRTWDLSALYFPDANYNSTSRAVTKATIPGGAQYNLSDGSSTGIIKDADEKPLLYDISSDAPVSYTDKIFVPEKNQDTETNLASAQAIVVGVLLEGIDETRYYRVDIAEYEGLKPIKFWPILRNHSYNIRLGGANNGGDKTPEDALKAPSAAWVSVEKWSEINLNYVLNGQYFFGIETSDLKLGWEKGSSITIPVKHDLTGEDASNAFSFAWKESNGTESPTNELFNAKFDLNAKKLVIETVDANMSNDNLTETLLIRFLNHQFEFSVTQSHRTAEYMISSNNIIVNGVYQRGEENVSGVNTATVRLYATNKSNSIKNMRYTLTAKLTDGYWVDASGLFDNVKVDEDGVEYMDVTIDIKGKTLNPKNKVLTVVTDADNFSLAAITIPVAYITKKVLGVFGGTANSLDKNPNFRKLIESDANFGLLESSRVKSEKIIYEESSDENLQSLISVFKPDVIIIGDGYNLTINNNYDALSNFLKTRQGDVSLSTNGVVIAMNTTGSMKEFMIKIGLFPSTSQYIAQGNYYRTNSLRDHLFYTFAPTPPTSEKVTYRFQIPAYSWDLVSNGAFGDIGAKFWLGDAVNGYELTYPIDTKILKYSGMVPFGCGRENEQERYEYGTTFFRAADYAFAWIGYPGLVSDDSHWHFENNDLIADNSSDNAYSVTSGSYETTKMKLCSNGILFANLLNWALYSAEYGNH